MNRILTKDNYRLKTLRGISRLMILNAKKYFRKESIDEDYEDERIFCNSVKYEGMNMYKMCNRYGYAYMYGYFIRGFRIRENPVDKNEVRNRNKTLKGYTMFI